MCKQFITFLLFSALICSCSDSSTDQDSSILATNYLPLKTNNYWTYDVDFSGTFSRDSLYVSNDTIIDSKTYKKIKTRNVPTGLFSSSLRNNGLRVNQDKLELTGSLGFDLGISVPIDFNVIDFVVFKENASVGQELSSKPGSFSQTLGTNPLNFEYTFKSYFDGNLASFTSSNGDVYSDVKKIKVVLNLKVTTTQIVFGFPVTVNVLAPQNVVVSYYYFAKNIGMVYSSSTISYSLASLPTGVTLPIPSSGSFAQEEFLDTYLIN